MALLICLVGCAAATQVAMLDEVGPRPTLVPQRSGDGYLQVYTARERAPIDVNAEEFFWNNDFGRNAFLHTAAHTSYSIYAPDGRLLERVRNTTGMNDANPTLVKLPLGVYRVEAKAEDYEDVTVTVMVPVRIEPGLTTRVHLDGQWNTPMATKGSGNRIVRLPNGDPVGWRLLHPGGAENPT